MKNKKIEENIKNAVTHLTPDVLDSILSKCDAQEQSNIYVIQPKPPKRRWVRTVGAVAAALVLVFGGLFTYQRVSDHKLDTLVMLDVNPSIEIRINKDNRVIDVTANNNDAVTILDHMDLKGTPIDVTVNALIGSMLKYGYIRENANSVLLSVEGADSEKSAVLQNDLTQSISQQLNLVNGAVISQNLTGDDTIQSLADEYSISYGKAALIQKIIAQNSHLLFADLAGLSVNNLNLLLSSKGITAEGMESQGNASDTDYIGEAKAKQIALSHAGLTENQVGQLHTELDYDDGMMVYDIEFIYNGREYEYEINAKDGTVIESDHENADDGDDEQNNHSRTESRENFIGEERAIQIATTHAGVQLYTGLEIELDKDDGLYIYEVEFDTNHKEYSYEIDAVTGKIISWEAEN